MQLRTLRIVITKCAVDDILLETKGLLAEKTLRMLYAQKKEIENGVDQQVKRSMEGPEKPFNK